MGRGQKTRERQSRGERLSARVGSWGLTGPLTRLEIEETCNLCVSVFHGLDPVGI